MPTTIPTTTSSTRPGSPSTGDAYFETDTNNYIIYDGAAWRSWVNDGTSLSFPSNSHSGDFDGSADYAVGSVSALNSNSAFSFSLWFRYQGSLSGVPVIFSNGSWTSGWYFSLDSTTGMTYGFNNTYGTWTNVPTMSDANWYHISLIHNGTSATLYFENSSLGSKTVASVNQTWVGNDLNLGRFGGVTGNYYQGYIDEVSVFNRALTSTEVNYIYTNKVYLDPTAIWRLNNDTTDELGNYDLTNNGVSFDGTNKAY